jgi:DNA ligase-1
MITFRYQELSDGGVPRFPSYVRVRSDLDGFAPQPVLISEAADVPLRPSVAPYRVRRFELVEGSSGKFWEVLQDGPTVTVRFGRIGSDGQSKTKDLGNQEAAQRHTDGLVKEKLGKGYREQVV